MLTKDQLRKTENWLYANARPLEVAKWNFLFGRASLNDVTAALLKYQNPDGGFGHGLEADMTTPDSSAVCSAAALSTAKEYGLSLGADWVKRMLSWFERTAQDSPSFWQAVPKSVEDYPHMSWWGYEPDSKFSPNPCAEIASALLCGTASQRVLGERAAARCVEYLLEEADNWMHNTYCLQSLVLALADLGSPLLTPEATAAMDRRITGGVCLDQNKWTDYEAQPLDFVHSPGSRWYGLLAREIPANLDYWERTVTDDGIWQPNWDYGIENDFSRAATKTWTGYIAVSRVKILKAFGRAEG